VHAARTETGQVQHVFTEARHAFERTYKPMWRRWVITKGTDVTSEHALRSCLVCAPHPDDETLGCGGLIARKRDAGTAVRVLVASNGAGSHVTRSGLDLAAIRAREVTEACRILGVAARDLVQLGLPDGELARFEDELVDRVAEEIDELRPDDVFVTSTRDWHPDHQALGRAARRAVARTRWVPRLLEYPIWWWVDGPWRRRDGQGRWSYGAGYAADTVKAFSVPTVELVATQPYLATKRRAIAAHRSQLESLELDTEWAVFDPAMRAALTGRFEVLLPVDAPRAQPTNANEVSTAPRATTSV
jgi:LmbE family N-acetylglucosaminyl deacetylase